MEDVGSNRIKFLDTIKAVSIFLVVFCHIPLLNNNSIIDNIAMSLCWAAVPCFFMCTGGIYLNKEWKIEKYIRKIFTIYFNICIWKIIYLIFFHFIGKIDILDVSKKSIFNYIFLFKGLKGVNDGHFWFMYAYLSIYMVYPIFNICFKYYEEYKKLIICILLIIFVTGILPGTIDLILHLFDIKDIDVNVISTINPFGNNSNMLFYFILGGMLCKNNIYEKFKDNKNIIRTISVISIIVGLVGLMLIKKHASNTFRWQGIYLINGYKRASTILLSLGVFTLLQGIKIKLKPIEKCVNVVATNTMGVFYLHMILLQFLFFIDMSGIIKYYGTVVNSIKCTIIIIIACAITLLIKKIPIMKNIMK